ncbi:outer membrane beta-barrel protein [Candidatus Halobeggiatoa sp. HSG11]|nr:outer membrane beta-barrel protein [Candidatus Halobeggiatoa sp. HSG11]
MRKILLFSLLLSSSVAIGAEISGYVGKLQFNSEFSNSTGLDEEAWTVDGRIDIDLQEHFSVEFGIGALFLNDKQKFEQEVTYIDDYYYRDTHIAESSETGFSLSIASKINYPITDFFSGNMLVGYEYMDFDREIADCDDCYSESVDINAGLFLGLGAGIAFGQDMELKFQYKMYLADEDVESQILVGFSYLM